VFGELWLLTVTAFGVKLTETNGVMANTDLLTNLLRDVSRSFYQTLRVLPSGVRAHVGLAYLLARATDTIADTALVPVDDRLAALDRLRARILGTTHEPLGLERFAAPGKDADPGDASAAERMLLARLEEALAVLAGFAAPDQASIRRVLTIITGGQELDLQRFGTAGNGSIKALDADADLDDYTYRVAGCVGEFWTEICRAHLFPNVRVDEAFLRANGVRFGQGLQLVNILRDLPRDLRSGRCYLPLPALATAGLTPQDLLAPATMPRFRPVYAQYVDRAESFLTDGWAYTLALPWTQVRVRLACAWPVLIGIQTLGYLRRNNVLDGSVRLKVTRAEVIGLMRATVLGYCWPGAWERLFDRVRRQSEARSSEFKAQSERCVVP
jgi:farnesyl-diphosphate farnesyltransferase